MDIKSLEFLSGTAGTLPEDPVNIACRDILDHLRALRDLNGERIFESAELGLTFPLASPDPRATPRARLWIDSQDDENLSVQFDQNDTNTALSIFVEMYSNEDIQEQRQRLITIVVNSLEALDARLDSELGDGDQRVWTFPNPQNIAREHVNVFHRIMGLYPVTPPHYVTRVGIAINGFYDI